MSRFFEVHQIIIVISYGLIKGPEQLVADKTGVSPLDLFDIEEAKLWHY